jgi:hypothetical protein
MGERVRRKYNNKIKNNNFLFTKKLKLIVYLNKIKIAPSIPTDKIKYEKKYKNLIFNNSKYINGESTNNTKLKKINGEFK